MKRKIKERKRIFLLERANIINNFFNLSEEKAIVSKLRIKFNFFLILFQFILHFQFKKEFI